MLSLVRQRTPRLGPISRLARCNSTTRTCPSCRSPLPSALPACPTCRFIAPLPSTMSYFQYFDLPESASFKIDTRDLRNRFLQAQRVCHPDSWAQKGQKEGTLASAQSSQLNKAYQTLLSPLLRAQYILSLHGHEEGETDSIEDQELIMEIMEAHQQVEDAGNLDDITRLREANQVKLDKTINQIASFISNKDWEATKEATVRLKYWQGIDKATQERLQELH